METIISGIVVFGILVLVHEFGHFVFAKKVGAKVEEFAFGYPPRLFAVKRGETEYALNLIPFGGYVRLLGEEDPSQEGSLASKSPWQRFQVLTAGAGMNLVLGILFFAATFSIGVAVAEPTEEVVILGVQRDSPAATAGIKADDVVLRLGTRPIKTVADLRTFTQENLGQETTIIVKRDGAVLPALTIVPRAEPPAGQGPLGVQIGNYRTVIQSYPLPQALWMGSEMAVKVVALTLYTPIMVAKGLIPADQARPVGVVGITQLTGSVVSNIATNGWVPVLNLIGLLNVGLAVAQLLPIPGLDGGRLLFVVIEWLRGGKRVSAQKEGMVHLAGMLVLVALMLVITYYDIVQPIVIPDMSTP